MTREICVLCGKKTDVDIKTPVENRSCWVDGAGQLCNFCYVKTYGK